VVIVTSGGIGANHELIRKNWPERLGKAPKKMISGVPDHVDGRMLEITVKAGGRLVNRDRMWHYTEGIKNWNPIWSNHGIRILPGPSCSITLANQFLDYTQLEKFVDSEAVVSMDTVLLKGPSLAAAYLLVDRQDVRLQKNDSFYKFRRIIG
jgi:predicted oxidoreductase